MAGVDLDIAACAYGADGVQRDVQYFKNPVACGGAISSMSGAAVQDAVADGWAHGREGTAINLNMLPPDVNFIFVVVSCRSGAEHLAAAGGASVHFVDGEVMNGRSIAMAPLNMPTESCLVGVVIRGPPHMYPPGWMLHITSGIPAAAGPGRDFNEAIPLIEEYLRASVPPELLANRPPNNPMACMDMTKENNVYFLDPRCTEVTMGLGWQSSCDLDLKAVFFDEWYQAEAMLYGGGSCQGARHSGNSRDGGGGGGGWGWMQDDMRPDETVTVRFADLHPDVKHIVFVLNISQGEKYMTVDEEGKPVERRRPPPNNFAHVRNCFANLSDPKNNVALSHFRLGDDARPGRTRMMCVLSRFSGGGAAGRWQLIAMGDPITNDLHASSVRRALVQRTRPDLLRPVHINFGVISGRGLKACDNGKSSDPYVRVKFFDHTQHKTKKVKKTLDPDWNEDQLYNWTGPLVDLLERIYCKVDIYDADMVRDDFMGRAYIHAREVIGTRGRGVIRRQFKLGEKHDEEGEQKRGFFDKMLGYTGSFPGELLLQWEVRAPFPQEV